MKKVILNSEIKDNTGTVQVMPSGRTRSQNGFQQQEIVNTTFAVIANTAIETSPATSDDEVRRLDALSKILVAAEPDKVYEISDEDFDTVKKIIDTRAMPIRARFLEMVDALNK